MQVNIHNATFTVETGVTPGDFYHWSLVNKNAWEPATFNLLKKYLNKDSIYIDIGAHFGLTVLYASMLCKHCHAIEPDPAAMASLQSNLKLNAIENVTCHPVAIGDAEGKRTLTFAEAGGSGSSLAMAYENSITVDCTRLRTH